jgi:hypothetical protein
MAVFCHKLASEAPRRFNVSNAAVGADVGISRLAFSGDANMALSVMAVRNAQGRERPYKVSDSRGLYLFVQPSGARYWRLAHRYDGKQRATALGASGR